MPRMLMSTENKTETQAKIEGFLASTKIFWSKGVSNDTPNEIAWESDIEGVCICPFIGLHTDTNGWKDCRVYADRGVIYCLHASCEQKRKSLNKKLRKVLGIVYKPSEAERKKAKSSYDQAKYLEQNR